MAWIESHQALREHPKTKRFKRILGVNVHEAVGLLHCFWWWSMDHAEDGDLSRFTVKQIAEGAEWAGDPDLFVNALMGAGFVSARSEVVQERGLVRLVPTNLQSRVVRQAWNALRTLMAPLVFARDGYRCVFCGARRPLTVDHIQPIARGGLNSMQNFQTLCRPCNSRKGSR